MQNVFAVVMDADFNIRRKPMQIKIDIDMEKKAITGVDIPKEIQAEPVALALIFQQLSVRTLSGIRLEPVSPIIKPKMKIVGGK
jgi:hypothetical protein